MKAPNMPFELRNVLDELQVRVNDTRETPTRRREAKALFNRLLGVAAEYEEIISQAEVRGYIGSQDTYDYMGTWDK